MTMELDCYNIPNEGLQIAYILTINNYKLANNPDLKDIPSFESKSEFNTQLQRLGYTVFSAESDDGDGVWTWKSISSFLLKMVGAIYSKKSTPYSFLLAISGHGSDSGIFTSDGYLLKFSIIEHAVAVNRFLDGVPKLIMYSSCHGDVLCTKSTETMPPNVCNILCIQPYCKHNWYE